MIVAKKHVSNYCFICCTRVSLHVCCMQVNSRLLPEKDQDIQRNSTPQNVIKHVNTKKIIFCQVSTYPYSRQHFHWTNWMPNMIMAQGLNSTGTNNLTRLVAQCTRVLYHKVQLRDLNWGAGTPFSIADTMLSLHN